MSERVRAFFAVPLPEAARTQAEAAVALLRDQARADVRWTPAESMHLTLKFLGAIEAAGAAKLLRSAAARLVREDAFDVELGGLGAFPNARQARIAWLGVTQGAPRLSRLARKLESAASRIGIERERRAFRPHLTLGRLREPAPLPIERVSAPAGEPFTVREVVLFESRLAPTGATYVPLARLPLALGAEEADAFQTDFAPEI